MIDGNDCESEEIVCRQSSIILGIKNFSGLS